MVFDRLALKLIVARQVLLKGKLSTIEDDICLLKMQGNWIKPLRLLSIKFHTNQHLHVALKSTVEQEAQQMLEDYIIWPSKSAWSSSVVTVWKKDHSCRCCIDFYKVNLVTTKDAPQIDSMLDSLFGAQNFSTLDLASSYWEVEVAETNREKTVFTTSQGLFKFNVGLTNVPTTFQHLMEYVLQISSLKLWYCFKTIFFNQKKKIPEFEPELELFFKAQCLDNLAITKYWTK